MIRTAYNLALHPTLPLKTFKLLVKCQRENGVALISGKEDHRAIKEKVAVIMGSTYFFNLLSDWSQARKTGSEKELVLIRVERGGIPTYICLSRLEMSNFGGTDAVSLKAGIDSIFAQDGFLPLDETDYTKKFVGATADGASVNFGRINGLLTRLEVSRPWLLKIHCSNHRTELGVCDVFDNKSPFSVIDDTYKGMFYHHRNSGKILNEVKEACASLDITYYKLRKIHGTIFISHRRRGFKCLLDIYPALLNAYEKVIANSTKSDVRAKVGGYLNKLKSFRFFMLLLRYLDITNCMSSLSLTFEKGVILPFDVVPAIKQTESSIREFECDDSSYERVKVNEDGEINVEFLKAGHSRKKKENREQVVIPFDFMTHDGDILRIVNAHAQEGFRISSITKVYTSRWISLIRKTGTMTTVIMDEKR